MKQVLGIRDEKARMKVTPPLAVAPITQENDTQHQQSGKLKPTKTPTDILKAL